MRQFKRRHPIHLVNYIFNFHTYMRQAHNLLEFFTIEQLTKMLVNYNIIDHYKRK